MPKQRNRSSRGAKYIHRAVRPALARDGLKRRVLEEALGRASRHLKRADRRARTRRSNSSCHYFWSYARDFAPGDQRCGPLPTDRRRCVRSPNGDKRRGSRGLDKARKYRGDLTSTARPRSNTCRVESRVKLSNGPRLCSPSDLSETHRTAAGLSIQTDELVQQTVLLFARRLAGEPRRLRARPTHPIPRWILSK